jgi:hypothetical protein
VCPRCGKQVNFQIESWSEDTYINANSQVARCTRCSNRVSVCHHARLGEYGPTEPLPTVRTFRITSPDPEEDARLGAGYLEHNRRVGRMLKEKNFGVAGDEPGCVQINRRLRLGGGRKP